ncbi:MAG: LuxR C-terminal-related transcriptional regulator [Anaerolineae bacterium]|nr:LuxR C-terminal-related transcriptional regulator [Anaerolineae bacterium]
MPMPILSTKLYIPPPRPGLVLRRRLIDRLNEGLHGKSTLISAPAGFGKTTLVSEWVTNCNRPTAWLSLDEGDNDLTRFLTYFVAALQTIAPTIGEGVLVALQSPQPPSTEVILTVFLNEIVTIPDDFLLVLDDYHLTDARPIDDALTFLLEHLPPRMHLVITTREDPNIPLARLRARRQLTELRAADLRFTPGEASAFLNQVMGLDLSDKDIDTLETRTEGWIAGLQLAAISMQSHQDVPGFIRAFAGDHHYIVDYLIEEVLERQPEPVRRFLLQSSILDRMNGSLCDAVTGQQEGNARLEALNRGNFFLIPLDNQRHWYRYHHLFAEVLRMHLMTEQPDQIAALHRRASEWYEQHDSPADAIHHALAAKDFGRAAGLVEMAMPAMRRSRQEATALGWFQCLPIELFYDRPVLSILYAGVLLQTGKLEGVEARLRDAERWLQPKVDTGEMVIIDEEEFRGLAGSIAMYRAAIALISGHLSDTMKHARQVLDLVPEDDRLRQGAAAALLGLAHWTSGNLEEAYQSYADGMAHLRMAGNISDVVGGTLALADIRIAQGRRREAMHIYEQALQFATEQGETRLRGTADMYVGMSEINTEYNNLYAAKQYLMRSEEQGEHTGFPQYRYRWRVAMARIRGAEGDLDSALDLLTEAERLYVSDFYPNVRPVAAFRTRVWIKQGRLDEALGWAREQNLSVKDDLSYLHEFEHITLARILLAQYQHDRADHAILDGIGLLERLLKAAQDGDRTGSVIEILILLALAHQLQGDTPAALTALEHALTLAEPEGYVRIFVDQGHPISLLLEKAAKHAIAPNYVHQLLQAFGKAEDGARVDQGLIEPLSDRELEVLRLLGTDLDGPDIARHLVVSLNTLRTHTKNIYTKLGVNNRREAVRRAGELGLL